jgi:hypothetical protein
MENRGATSSMLTTFFLAIALPQKIKVKVQAEVKKNQVFSTLTLPACAALAGQPPGLRKTGLTLT